MFKTNLWDWIKAEGEGAASPTPPTPTPVAASATPDSAPPPAGDKSTPSLLNEPIKDPVDPKAADPKAEAVPEKYEFKAPEGTELNKEALAAAEPIFKELGLSQAKAQKLVDLYSAQTKSLLDGQMKVWKETQEGWVNTIKADPEIGGKLDQVRATVAKTLDLLPPDLSKQFREAMDFTGVGNHPAFVKAFYQLGLKLTEGGSVSGRPAGGQRPATPGAALYPNLPSAG